MAEINSNTGRQNECRVARKSPIKILMVDDDSTYRELCKRYLSKDSNNTYHLVGVSDAATAINTCREEVFDCMLIDYMLPDSFGTDVISNFHKELGDTMPPAVILTAGGGEEAATQAIRVNAADFLSKRDVSSKSLCRSINNAVKQARLETEIRDRNEKLNMAYTQLQHRSEEIKNFYHTVSHEVKTPLTALREFLSLLNDEVLGPISADQKEILVFSLESCDQISDHFNDLIDLARAESGKLRLKRHNDSPKRLIHRCLTGIAGIAREKGINVIDKSSDDLPEINIDTNRIAQVLLNLLNNAIKHTETGGYVHVFSEYDIVQNHLEIRVQDSGCGISEEHIDRIFDRLYQVNEQSDNYIESSPGLGLGLSIARELALLHGGQLNVESRSGEGSTFILRLPVQEADTYKH